MEDVIVALPPLYRDFSTSDKHYVKNYGLTCAGILIALIIVVFAASLPALINQVQHPGTIVSIEMNPEFVAAMPYYALGTAVATFAIVVGGIIYSRRGSSYDEEE